MRSVHLRSVAVGFVLMSIVLTALFSRTSPVTAKTTSASPIEPKAGTWKTWVLTSGSQFRLPAPGDQAATEAEIKQLKDMVPKRDAAALDQIAF